MKSRSHGERVSDRSFRYNDSDLALIEEIFSDPLFLKFMQPRKRFKAMSKSDLEMRLLCLARGSSVDHSGLRVIYSGDKGEPIGVCGVLVNSSGLDLPEISIYIRKSCRGRGFAKQSLGLIVSHFNGLRLGAFVDYENQRSQALMETIGMTRSGVAYHPRLEREGLLFVGVFGDGQICPG